MLKEKKKYLEMIEGNEDNNNKKENENKEFKRIINSYYSNYDFKYLSK